MHAEPYPILNPILELERVRESRVLVLAASHLETELLPALYEQCLRTGVQQRLDVVLYGRGGVVNAARRIGLLLREFAHHLAFIVPYHCESSATLLTLCADEVIAGELAHFSPIDPHLNGAGGSGGAGTSAFSCQDIRLFGEMCRDWFGVDVTEARTQSLALMCNSVFPPSLTAFYRSTQELEQIGAELLAHQLPQASSEQRLAIVRQLMFGYHSHHYAITGRELAVLGLTVRRDVRAEALAWDIARPLQARIGGAQRQIADAPWCDALLASRDGVRLRVRQRQPDGAQGQWCEGLLT